MGRHRSSSTSSSSSSSSSSNSNSYNYKRSKKVSRRSKNKTRTASRSNVEQNETIPVSMANSNSPRPSTSSDNNKASDQRIERLELLVERLIQDRSSQPPPPPPRALIRAECVPEFSPGNPNLNCSKWIAKIEQLAVANQWDESTIIFNMQSRLTGLARNWYDNLQSYQNTWDEWKTLLIKTFPEHRDFATLLRNLVNRFKQPNETWEQYYFNKLDLLNACEINGKKAISCLIDGIRDPTIQAGARAGRYSTPDELYAEYLSSLKSDVGLLVTLERTSSYSNSFKRKFGETRRDAIKRPKVGDNYASSSSSVKCYNCKKRGHYSNKCTQPRMECNSCKRLGHVAKDCRWKQVKSQVVESQREANKNYFFDCCINSNPTRAYIDSGCGAVLIRQTNAIDMNLKISPSTMTIVGYGGTEVAVLGETEVSVKIDLAEGNVRALVVPDSAQEVPVMIGQTFLNRSDVVMIISGETVRILPSEADLSKVFDLPARKIPLWAKSRTIIPPRTSALVAITSRGTVFGDVYVRGGLRPVPGHEYNVDECVTKSEDGFITVTNLSHQEIEVSENQILARCVMCFEDNFFKDPVTVLNVGIRADKLLTRNDLSLNPNLTVEQVNSVVDLVNEFRCCFADNTKELGKTDVIKMSIHLSDNTPVVYRPYRLSYNERKVVKGMIDDLLENKIVRESDSPYSSPILLVKKKNGEQRMCVDYRKLNSRTIKDKYPLPRVDEFLEKLKGSLYFTSLDLASGYHQIEMEEQAIPKTAFTTPDGHYEYLRVPFGLCNAPAIFQRAINKVLGNLRYGKVLAYMDDLLLPSSTFDLGLSNLREVLFSFKNAGLTLRLTKCHFFMEKVEYLGHEISKDGVRPGARKTEAVKSFPLPVNVHSVRQFLGLAGYFRKYIKDFATIAKPLTHLIKKDVQFSWGNEHQEAFEALKEKLVSRPVLAIYDPERQTEIHTDASKWGIAGILLQVQKDDTLKPVLYFSRQTNKHEQVYHSYELETMAVVESLKQFRIYLIGIEFKVITDCNAIRSTLSKRDLIPRIARWWLSIQEYTFTVEYRPGHKMLHADALSRNPVNVVDNQPDTFVNLVNINEKDWVLNAQLSDSRCKYIVGVLIRSPEDKEEHEIHKDYCIDNNRLYKITPTGKKWLVPKMARRQLLLHFHDGIGHLSTDKTLSAISKLYWFPGMRRYVKKFISCCLPCLYNKQPGGKQPGYLHPIEKISEPFDTIHIDHLGPFVKSKRKNMYLIVIVDAFTKFVFMKSVPSTKVRPLISFLDSVIENFGVPKRIISDRGSCYTSKQFSEYCRGLNIKHVLNATATPRANGQVERYNRTILSSLSASTCNEEKWDEMVPKVRWGLNSTINSTTGKSPYELLFGYSPRGVANSFLDNEVSIDIPTKVDIQSEREKVKVAITKKQGRSEAQYNVHRCTGRKYNVGQQILVRTTATSNEGRSRKLLPKYSGPYTIVKVLDHDRYVIKDVQGSTRSQRNYKGIVSLDKMKPYNVEVSSESNEDSDVDEN